jgi:hypothetical protein
VRLPGWLDPLRRELDAAASPRAFFFRDDDAGWASRRLIALLDLFARYAVPLDVAVIPVALDARLAAQLRRHRASTDGLVDFHQHGFTHANHQPSGRPFEFGPGRPAAAQCRDIAAGARRLRRLLGRTAPIFTPPWNRCTPLTGRCLIDLGFRALARDASADPLEVEGLHELPVHVDWSRRQRGCRISRTEVGALLAELLSLLARHDNARCVPLTALVAR